MIRARLPVLIAIAIAAAALSSCSGQGTVPANTVASALAPAAAAEPGVEAPTAKAGDHAFTFRIGELQAVALKDGDLSVPNDGSTFAMGEPAEAVNGLLAAAGQATDQLHLNIQPLLVRSGERVLLFDTGAGDESWANGGHLAAALAEAGVAPAQVTDIFLSHRHGDHVGGLRNDDGALAFPNATIRMSAAEWGALQSDEGATGLVTAIQSKVAPFEAGAELVPGVVTAVAIDGHTPGHSAYRISSGNEHLLYIGDTVHHHVISVQQPEWTVQFDEDAPVAEASRRALLQRAVDEDLRIYAVHFPYPGLGRFKAQGEGFVWVAED